MVNTEDGVASVEDLADEIGKQADTPKDRKRIHVRLHHVAVPKLADMGFIDYDVRSDTVRYREHPVLEGELQCIVESSTVT